MNWQAQRPQQKAIGMTAAATAALAALGLASAPVQAQNAGNSTVASSASVTLLAPFPGTSFSGSKQIEISAFYQDSSASGGITTVEILIDGQSAAVKKLDRPELRGVVSFLIDPTTLDLGTHQILIRVTSVAGDHPSVRTSIRYNGDDSTKTLGSPALDITNTAAGVTVLSPRPSDHVSGIVTIQVNAVDPTGKSPYVSVFIDKVFKSLRNHPPYTFDWDTTRTTNGWHTIEVSGFNDDEQLGKAAPVRVYVNNGGGDTTIDRGLTDTAPAPAAPSHSAASAPAPASVQDAAQPVETSEPDVVSADDARLAKEGTKVPDVAATAQAKLASSSIGEGALSEQILLAAPFLQKLTIEPPLSPIPATLAHPADALPGAPVQTDGALASSSEPRVQIASAMLAAPTVSPIEQPIPSASTAALAAIHSLSTDIELTQPSIAHSTADAAVVSSGLAQAPTVSPLPVEEAMPKAPAKMAMAIRSDVAFSLPESTINSTVDVVVSSDTQSQAPAVSAKTIEESAPTIAAEMAKIARPGTEVNLPSATIGGNAEIAASSIVDAQAPTVSALTIEPGIPTSHAAFAVSARTEQSINLPGATIGASTDVSVATDTNSVAPVVSPVPVAAAPAPMAAAILAKSSHVTPDLSLPAVTIGFAPEVAVAQETQSEAPVVGSKPVEVALVPATIAELAHSARTSPDLSLPAVTIGSAPEVAVAPVTQSEAPVVASKPVEVALVPTTIAELAHSARTSPDVNLPVATIGSSSDVAVSSSAQSEAPVVGSKPIEVALVPATIAELAHSARTSPDVNLPAATINGTTDVTLSTDASSEAPAVSAKPIGVKPVPMAAAEMAKAERPSSEVTLPASTIAAPLDVASRPSDAQSEAPPVSSKPIEVKLAPMAAAELANVSHPTASVNLPASTIGASTDVMVADNTVSQAPAVSTKPIEAAAPAGAATMAKTLVAPPTITVGSQILASAGYTPGSVDADVALKAPFMVKKSGIAPPSDIPPVNARMAIPSATSNARVAPSTSKMASAAINMAPDGASVLATPNVAPAPIDPSNVPHASVVVARPASGLFSSSVCHKLAGQFEVVMDDRPVVMDRPMQDHGNVLCAPIRQIVESKGGELFWSSKTKSVRALMPTRDIQLQIGSPIAKVNNVDQKLTTSPYIASGRTMIPVGFLPIALDVVVNYDAATGHLEINSKD